MKSIIEYIKEGYIEEENEAAQFIYDTVKTWLDDKNIKHDDNFDTISFNTNMKDQDVKDIAKVLHKKFKSDCSTNIDNTKIYINFFKEPYMNIVNRNDVYVLTLRNKVYNLYKKQK